MKPFSLGLEDRALSAARGGNVLASVPSAVFVGRSAQLPGIRAWEAVRSHPMATSTRHLGSVLGGGATDRAALLVADELAGLIAEHPPLADEPVWICACARAQAPGLGTLLGIARDLSLRVGGFIDSATVSVAALGLQHNAIVLELGLHHAAATAIDVDSGQARRRRTVIAENGGLLEVYQAWLDLISTTMVKRTRFDPLHDARIEQQLFDRLPELAREAVARGSTTAVASKGGERFQVELTHDQFVAAAERVFRRTAGLLHELRPAGASVKIVVPREVADLPGLREKIGQFTGCELVRIPDGFAAAVTSLLDLPPARSDQDSVRLLRRLPLQAPAALGEKVSRELLGPRHFGGPGPSHVLFDGRAYSLDEQPVIVGRAPEGAEVPEGPGAARSITLPDGLAGVSRRHCTFAHDNGDVVLLDHSSFGTFVNGERVAERVRLHAGDRVQLGDPGVELELIAIGDSAVNV